MRICVAHGGDLGEPSGGTTRVGALVRGLTARDVDVTVVAPGPSGSLPPAFDDAKMVAVDVGTRGVVDQPVRAVRVARRARSVAGESGARLQIEHSTLGGVAALLGSRGFVLDMHDLAHHSPQYGDLPLGSALQRALKAIEGRALRAATAVVVVSEHMREIVCRTWNVPVERVTVVPNGYDPSTVEPYRDVEVVPGRVAFLGTLHRKVDVEALLETARRPAVSELVVVGDGAGRAKLERAAASTPALRVTGRLPDEEAFPLVASADVAVNPQRGSTLQAASCPVKLYYYAALGLPMVLTDGPAIAQELADAGAARIVSPGGAFAGAVVDLLAAADRTAMGERAAEWAAGATWDERAADLARVHGVSPDA